MTTPSSESGIAGTAAVETAAPVAPVTPVAPTVTPAAPAAGTITLPDGMGDWLKGKGITDTTRFTSDEAIFKLANSYRETEKWALGGDKIVIPKGLEGDALSAAMNQVYDKLGRPGAPADYKFEIPQGGDSEFALKAGEVFHKAGLNQDQAAKLNAWWNEQSAGITAAQAEADATAVREDSVKLDKEWGGDKKHNTELATRGWNEVTKVLGLEGEAAEALQDKMAEAIGLRNTLQLLKAFGERSGTTGDTFETPEGLKGGAMGMTPESAKQRIEALKTDQAFQARRNKGDAAAVAEWTNLHKAAANGQVFSG